MSHPLSSVVVACASLALFVGILFFSQEKGESQPRFATWGSGGTISVVQNPERARTSEEFTFEQTSVLLPSLREADIPRAEIPKTNPVVFRSSLPQAPDSLRELSDILSLVPTGLLSPTARPTRSPAQEALYAYGNTAGDILEDLHTRYGARQTTIMKDFYSDRTNQSKQAEVRNLAQALSETGSALASLEDVPSNVASLHEGLASGYRNLGSKLSLLTIAQGDEDLLVKINDYNSAVESFAASYIGIAQLFSTMGVTFTQSDTGRMFVFTGQAGL